MKMLRGFTQISLHLEINKQEKRTGSLFRVMAIDVKKGMHELDAIGKRSSKTQPNYCWALIKSFT